MERGEDDFVLNVWIDDLTPCLKDNETGDFVQTEVIRIRRKSFLSKFLKRDGWYTDWAKLLQEHEVYVWEGICLP